MTSPDETTIMIIASCAPGKEARLRELTYAFAKHVAEDEPNTVTFEVHEGEAEGKLQFAILERYKTKADMEKHLATPEVAELFQRFQQESLTTDYARFDGRSTGGFRQR